MTRGFMSLVLIAILGVLALAQGADTEPITAPVVTECPPPLPVAVCEPCPPCLDPASTNDVGRALEAIEAVETAEASNPLPVE